MKQCATDGAETPDHLRRTPQQARCDAIQAAFHSGDTAPPGLGQPPEIAPTDDVLKLSLAEELDYARAMLDEMGDELATDMGVVMRHSVALQAVDIVGQMLGHIANVVRSSDPGASVDLIGMCELKARLVRKGRI